jgi:hypothetical protein
MGEQAILALPDLIKALTDSEPAVRNLAALTLGCIGREARAAVPALLTALHGHNSTGQRRIVVALGEMIIETRTASMAKPGERGEPGTAFHRAVFWALKEIDPSTLRGRAA